MNKMIERAASAMFLAEMQWKAANPGYFPDDLRVRAVIEAMREPTEAMIDAACCCERGDTVGDALRDEYQAMIDAALSTPPDITVLDIIIACGKCGWQGHQSRLDGNNCPMCGAAFQSWPLSTPVNGKT